jgi:Uma2 family endonuclease
MTPSSAPSNPNLQPPPFPVRRFTVAEYHQMIQTGILNEEDHVELLEGWIVPKMARNPPHDSVLDQAQEVIRARLPQGWRLWVQSAITTADSEPEPDLAVVPGPASRYRTRHPEPPEVALVVEVAESTLAHDRLAKGRLYARAGLPLYWIVNLVDTQLEVYTDPTGPDPTPRYRQRQDLGLSETVMLTLPGQTGAAIPVAELFG